MDWFPTLLDQNLDWDLYVVLALFNLWIFSVFLWLFDKANVLRNFLVKGTLNDP
jgi:hypothetical protein